MRASTSGRQAPFASGRRLGSWNVSCRAVAVAGQVGTRKVAQAAELPSESEKAYQQASGIIDEAENTSYFVPQYGRVKLQWQGWSGGDQPYVVMEASTSSAALNACSALVPAQKEQVENQQRLQLLALEAKREQLLYQLREIQQMRNTTMESLERHMHGDFGTADITALLQGIRCPEGRCGVSDADLQWIMGLVLRCAGKGLQGRSLEDELTQAVGAQGATARRALAGGVSVVSEPGQQAALVELQPQPEPATTPALQPQQQQGPGEQAGGGAAVPEWRRQQPLSHDAPQGDVVQGRVTQGFTDQGMVQQGASPDDVVAALRAGQERAAQMRQELEALAAEANAAAMAVMQAAAVEPLPAAAGGDLGQGREGRAVQQGALPYLQLPVAQVAAEEESGASAGGRRASGSSSRDGGDDEDGAAAGGSGGCFDRLYYEDEQVHLAKVLLVAQGLGFPPLLDACRDALSRALDARGPSPGLYALAMGTPSNAAAEPLRALLEARAGHASAKRALARGLAAMGFAQRCPDRAVCVGRAWPQQARVPAYRISVHGFLWGCYMAGMVCPGHPEDVFMGLLTHALLEPYGSYTYESFGGTRASSAGATFSNFILSPGAPGALAAQQLLAIPLTLCLERCAQRLAAGGTGSASSADDEDDQQRGRDNGYGGTANGNGGALAYVALFADLGYGDDAERDLCRLLAWLVNPKSLWRLSVGAEQRGEARKAAVARLVDDHFPITHVPSQYELFSGMLDAARLAGVAARLPPAQRELFGDALATRDGGLFGAGLRGAVASLRSGAAEGGVSAGAAPPPPLAGARGVPAQLN